MTSKRLYKFSKWFGRNGTLEGIFIAEQDEVNKLIKDETHIYFGEALGKHSSISCVIKQEDITELNVNYSTIDDLLLVIGDTITGYNPLHYLEEEE